MSFNVLDDLLTLLEKEGEIYHLLKHKPIERLDLLGRVCGCKLAQVARVNLLVAKTPHHSRKYYLAVVPGDCQLSLPALQSLDKSLYLMFAPARVAEELSGCSKNTIPPFAFHPDFQLVVDPALLENDEVFFSAGRSDHSISMGCDAYLRVAQPRIAPIIATRLFY